MADFNIYDDLELLHVQQEQKAVEDLQWKEKYQVAIGTLEELQNEKKELCKKIKQLEINFASLLETARTEIKRKDNQIAELRREKDNICFRRNANSSTKLFVNESTSKESKGQSSYVNPFAIDPPNMVSKNVSTENRRVGEALVASTSKQRNGAEEFNKNRCDGREPPLRNDHDGFRKRNRSRDALERHSETNFGPKCEYNRNIFETRSSDSSRAKSNKIQTRDSQCSRSHHYNESTSTNIQKDAKYKQDSRKERKDNSEIFKNEPDGSNAGIKKRASPIKEKASIYNTDHQKIASLAEEIQRDIKEFKKLKLFDAEKVEKPEEDVLAAEIKKSNIFIDALFEDITINNEEQSGDFYTGLKEAQPMDVCINAEDAINGNDKNIKEIIANTDENYNVELQLRTPLKQSVTTIFDDLFGPSPAGNTRAVIRRKKSVTSVGESSNDTVDFKNNQKEKIVSSSKTFVVADLISDESSTGSNCDTKHKDKSLKKIDEINRISDLAIASGKPYNVDFSCPANPVKSVTFIDLDSSLNSSDEECGKPKESCIDQSESQSDDVESPPFENLATSSAAIKNDNKLVRTPEKKLASGENIKNNFTVDKRKYISENVEGKHRTDVGNNKSDKATATERFENKAVLKFKMKHKTDDMKKDLTDKLTESQPEKQKDCQSSRHSSKNNEKNESNPRKDPHKHLSKHCQSSSSSRTRYISEKDTRRSDTEKQYYKSTETAKLKHESHRKSETENKSSSHRKSEPGNKSSSHGRHHRSREIKEKSIMDCPTKKDTTKDFEEIVHSSVDPQSLQEDNSSDLKLYNDHINFLYLDDVSNDVEKEVVVMGEPSTNDAGVEKREEKAELNAVAVKKHPMEVEPVMKPAYCTVEPSEFINAEKGKMNGTAESEKSLTEGEPPPNHEDISCVKSSTFTQDKVVKVIKDPDFQKPIDSKTDDKVKSSKEVSRSSGFVTPLRDIDESVKYKIDAKIQQKVDTQYAPTDVTKMYSLVIPNEEPVSSTRRRKGRIPRKCTDEVNVLQDSFLKALVDTNVPAQLQTSAARANTDSARVVCSDEAKDLINPFPLKVNKEISGTSCVGSDKVERSEMPVLRVEEESELLLVQLSTKENEKNHTGLTESKPVSTSDLKTLKKIVIKDVTVLDTAIDVAIYSNEQQKENSLRNPFDHDVDNCSAVVTSDNKNNVQISAQSEVRHVPLPVSTGSYSLDDVVLGFENSVTINNKRKYKKKSLPNFKNFDILNQHNNTDLQNSSVSGSNDFVVQQLMTKRDDVKKLKSSASSQKPSDSSEHRKIFSNSPGSDDNNGKVSGFETVAALSDNPKKLQTINLQNKIGSKITDKPKSNEQIIQLPDDFGIQDTSDNRKKERAIDLQIFPATDAACPAAVGTVDTETRQGRKTPQESSSSENKRNHKKTILQAHADAIVATNYSLDQQKNILQNSVSIDVTKVKSPIKAFPKKNVFGSTDIVETINRMAEPPTTFDSNGPCSHVPSISAENTLQERDATSPLKTPKLVAFENAQSCNEFGINSLDNGNLNRIVSQPTSSTNNQSGTCLNESLSHDEEEQNAVYIKRKMKSNKHSKDNMKKHNQRYIPSDTINIIEEAAQPKRSRQPQNSANGFSPSPTVKSEKMQRATEKRKRSPSSEDSVLSCSTATPTHHKIFQNDSFPDQQACLPPAYNANDDDVQYQEIDNRMRCMFQSPTSIHSNGTSVELNGDISKNNSTIEETFNQSAKSQCDTSPIAKKISVGSNNYLIEPIGAHTTKVSITRKKRKKRIKIA